MSKLGQLFIKPKKPAPLPDLPTRKDPELEIARKKAIVQARVRSGRRKSIFTSSSGLEEDEDIITRPGARRAKLLGN